MTDEKIIALHPDPDKQGTRISKAKYEVVAEAIQAVLAEGDHTFTALTDAVGQRIGATFDGSVGWYVTTVKLDLEARGVIERIAGSRPQRLRLVAA